MVTLIFCQKSSHIEDLSESKGIQVTDDLVGIKTATSGSEISLTAPKSLVGDDEENMIALGFSSKIVMTKMSIHMICVLNPKMRIFDCC